jgi:hypothetical protein
VSSPEGSFAERGWGFAERGFCPPLISTMWCRSISHRVICDCSTALKMMSEEEKAAVPPHYDPVTGRVVETFNIDRDHFWVESWTLMEVRDLLLEMHGPASNIKDPTSKRYYACQYCAFRGQKQCLNLHRHHGLCKGEGTRGLRLKSYPTIPWADIVSSMRTLSMCTTPDEVLRMFRDVKLRGAKKSTEGASVADNLAMSERTDKSGKRAAESEAHSRLPKKSAAASPAPKKRLLRQRPPAPKREVSSESSSDSYTGSFALPGTPNSDDDFEGTEVDKIGTGRSKRKKFEGSLERAIAAKDLQKRGE